MLFVRPCKGRITSHFNLKRKHPISGKIIPHWGTDFGNHSDNTIVAAQSGKVRIASQGGTGFGKYIVITHSNGWETVYAHLSSLAVRVGQNVTKGQRVGVKGTTGNSTGIHLHFELSKGRWTNKYRHHVNPVGYIDDSSIALSKDVIGPRIGILQQKLNKHGYKLAVDDVFGRDVESAVKDFQKKSNLTVDGIAGATTFKALDKEPTKEDDIMSQPFKPTSHTISKSVQDVIYSQSKKEWKKETSYVSDEWRKKYLAGEMTISDAIGLIYVMIDRGAIELGNKDAKQMK